MNNKATAVVMAVIMAVVGFTVVAVDGADAADTKITVSTSGDSNTDTSYVMAINEGNYAYYDYTLTWNITVGSDTEELGAITKVGGIAPDMAQTFNPVYVSSSVSTSSTGSDYFSVKLVRDSTVGVFHLDITGMNPTSSDVNITVKPTIKVTVGGIEEVMPDFAEYSLDVAVISTSDNGSINVELDSGIQAKVGSYYDNVIVPPTGMAIGDYDWYAVGLPSGLTMTNTGHVTGIPTVEDIDGVGDNTPNDGKRTYSFKVYATSKVDASMIYYDLKVPITISQKDPATAVENVFTYAVNKVEGESSYLFNNSEKITLTLTKVNGDEEITAAKVKVITDLGVTDQPYTEGGVVLPSTGSGAYSVQITFGGVSTSFQVYIIGNAGTIDANIVISGA